MKVKLTMKRGKVWSDNGRELEWLIRAIKRQWQLIRFGARGRQTSRTYCTSVCPGLYSRVDASVPLSFSDHWKPHWIVVIFFFCDFSVSCCDLGFGEVSGILCELMIILGVTIAKMRGCHTNQSVTRDALVLWLIQYLFNSYFNCCTFSNQIKSILLL